MIALVVPMLFYLVGAFSKKIIRDGSRPSFFILEDWFLAPDALLVSVGSMLAEFTSLVAKFDSTNHHGNIRGFVFLMGFSVCAYIMVLALHRHYESPAVHSTKVRCWWLVVVANVIAVAVMMMWLISIKGVSDV